MGLLEKAFDGNHNSTLTGHLTIFKLILKLSAIKIFEELIIFKLYYIFVLNMGVVVLQHPSESFCRINMLNNIDSVP